jgi:hypothetical protein
MGIISSNTLFHFTRSKDNLLSILRNNFYPQLCYENFYGTIFNSPQGAVGFEKAVPMVCFCDLPLSQIEKHTKNYGEYALGLTKEWAVRNKINPIIYTYPGSDFSEILKNLFLNFPHQDSGIQKENHLQLENNDFANQLASAIQYIKPYEGRLWKNGRYADTIVRYYDEREWRFIPKLSDKLPKPLMLRIRGEEERKAFDKINNDLKEIDGLKLRFEPKDIKYIIVKSESEILSVLDEIIQIKRDNFSYSDVQVLATRITSLEAIGENF